jgi:hypothetical protein
MAEDYSSPKAFSCENSSDVMRKIYRAIKKTTHFLDELTVLGVEFIDSFSLAMWIFVASSGIVITVNRNIS